MCSMVWKGMRQTANQAGQQRADIFPIFCTPQRCQNNISYLSGLLGAYRLLLRHLY